MIIGDKVPLTAASVATRAEEARQVFNCPSCGETSRPIELRVPSTLGRRSPTLRCPHCEALSVQRPRGIDWKAWEPIGSS